MNNKNKEKLLKHSGNAKRLADEGFSLIETDGALANLKFKKAMYELDVMSKTMQQVITELEETQVENELANILCESASGTVEIIGNDWLHLRLEMTLPSDRNFREVKKLSNTVTNLLDCHAGYLGYLPQYEQAFVAIVEHKGNNKASSYDHDNKGYRAIPNVLKGRVFDDDDQFTMSLGLFTVHDENDPHCDIYVIPIEDIASFAAHFLIF